MVAESIFKKTTLKELGNRLPIGIFGMRNQSFSFKEKLFFKDQKEIAKVKNEPDLSIGRYISKILGHLVEKVGDQNIQQMSESDKLLFFYRMNFADVLYMYYMARAEKYDSKIEWKITCPFHEYDFTFDAELGSTEVEFVEWENDVGEIVWDIELRDGLEYKGEIKKKVTLRTPYWGIFHSNEFLDKPTEAEVASIVLQNCILKVDDEPLPITDVLLEEGLTAIDSEILSRSVSEHLGGPQIVIEVKCPRCRRTIVDTIKWMDPNFLSLSSGATSHKSRGLI